MSKPVNVEMSKRMIFKGTAAFAPASQGARFAGWLVDMLMILVIAAFAVFLLLPQRMSKEEGEAAVSFFFLLFFVPYYALMESLSGRTIGKLLFRTRVVSEDGAKIGFRPALLRTLCRFIPFDAFSYLEAWPVGWHDKLSKTRVVTK